MPNLLKELQVTDETSFPYLFEQHVSIITRDNAGPVRCNVYRPKGDAKHPVLVTYGPYGKDVPYKE